MVQPTLFSEESTNVEDKRSSTFVDNMKLPIHRWYRYTAGFSANWVASVIREAKKKGQVRVLDPFAGSGTVPLESVLNGVDSYGIESNPFVCKIANAKLAWMNIDKDVLIKTCRNVLLSAKSLECETREYPDLVSRCFPHETLRKLTALKLACEKVAPGRVQDFVWFVITSIFRTCSPVGTAQWQYIQPRKTKSKVLDPYEAFAKKIDEILSDIVSEEGRNEKKAEAHIVLADARENAPIPSAWANLVVTSPPYANNYDYADAMRLEMLFWGEINGWKDLQEKVSVNLVRACTQHVGGLQKSVSAILGSNELASIKEEIEEKYQALLRAREGHGGKKNYHLMIVAYFYDLSRVLRSLNRMTSDDCRMCFVIGDSAPYGVYIPVDDWLGKLAVAAGFRCYRFEKLRDRNVKWKNRKHRVPLKEGRLWIDK